MVYYGKQQNPKGCGSIITVEKLTGADLSFLTRLLNKPEILCALHMPPSDLGHWQDAYDNFWVNDENELYFILKDGGIPVGWMKLNGFDSPDGEAWVSMLAVDPRFMRRGIATFAIAYAEKLAAERGFRKVSIHTNEDNLPARSCYEKLGYICTEKSTCTNADGAERLGRTYSKSL